MFKVGQRVVYKTIPHEILGTVKSIDDDLLYPVVVELDNGGEELFTEDGKFYMFENTPVVLFPVEESEPSPQDFLSELKALLEKYDVRVQAGLYEHGQLELQIWSGGERVKTIDGWMFYSGDF